MKTISAAAFALLLAFGICAPAQSVSLWKDSSKPLTGDLRATQVGDVVTVLVVESATSTQGASTELNRSSRFKVGPGEGFLVKNIPGIGYGGNSTSTGEGTTNRTSNLVTTLTCTVTEVRDNGMLVLKGERTLQTNDEKQQITLSGVVRPADVTPQNTVISTDIAEAEIKLIGNGPIGARQKEGIFTRLIRLLF